MVLYNACCVPGMFTFTYIHLVHKHTHTHFLLLSIRVVVFYNDFLYNACRCMHYSHDYCRMSVGDMTDADDVKPCCGSRFEDEIRVGKNQR